MPSIVYDFPTIARQMKGDTWFKPEAEIPYESAPQQSRAVPPAQSNPSCPKCFSTRTQESIDPKRGAWWCIPCGDWF